MLPEPIYQEAPPPVPDEGLLIEKAIPPDTTVTAHSSGVSCTVSVALPEVLYPSGANLGAATVYARFFLNLNNAEANEALTIYPLSFDGTFDLPLGPAITDEPTVLSLPTVTINLTNYETYFTQPTAGASQPNILEVFVSNGFNTDPAKNLWEPTAQASQDHNSWYVDLTNCPSFYAP